MGGSLANAEACHNRRVELVFSDEHYVAFDKPSGVVVHRQPGDREERPALQRARDHVRQHVYPIHRLDRSASGVLVFGRTPDAARRLAEAFAARTIDKRYVAVARGTIAERGTVDYPIRADRDAPLKSAVSDFVRLGQAELDEPVPPHPTARYSLVALRPRTGRTHQLRRHMAHLRHPIVGDVRHGDGRHNRVFRARLGSHRLLLWATRLAFVHPYTGEAIRIEAAPADGEVLTALGWPSHPDVDALG